MKEKREERYEMNIRSSCMISMSEGVEGTSGIGKPPLPKRRK